MAYLRTIDSRRTLRDHETLSHNAGIVSKADIWTQLRRFLILGTEGGSYYQPEHELTIQNIEIVDECLAMHALQTIDTIVAISDAGRAPSNDPAILALAMASVASVPIRKIAWESFPAVVRTGTHLLHFVAYRKALGGTGCYSFKRAIERWFNALDDADKLAYQMVKYQNRDGYSMRDVLRLAHPRSDSFHLEALYAWVKTGEVRNDAPDLIKAYALAHSSEAPTSAVGMANFVEESKLPFEALPTAWLKEPRVWEALLPTMGMTAMVRNLGRMTSIGLINDNASVATVFILNQLLDQGKIGKSRIHPMQLLVALKTYQGGRGVKGSLTWKPNKRLVNGLDEAFYLAFGNVQPTGKRTRLCIDISGSMTSMINNLPISCREAAAALCLVTANVEEDYEVVAFHDQLFHYDITPSMRLDEVLRTLPMDGRSTHCHLPITQATHAQDKFDAFVFYTDSENGGRPVTDAIAQYRGAVNANTKLVINAMVANRVSIGDPTDTNSLDVVGFDIATPQVISDFVGGLI